MVPSSCPRCGLGKCTKDNKLNLNIITKATIDVPQVEKLLRVAVEGQTGMKVKHIEFKTTTQYSYRDEPGTKVFSGIEVEFEFPTK